MGSSVSTGTSSKIDPSECMRSGYHQFFFDVNPPTKSRKELYREALLEVKADRGTQYNVSQEDLDALTSLRTSFGPFVSQIAATKEVVDHNQPGRQLLSLEMDAIARLRRVLKDHDWSPDIVIKAFRDLDTVFFCGKLHGKVTMRWSSPEDLAPFMRPGEFILGVTNTRLYGEKFDGTVVTARPGLGFRQTTIRLSARNLFLTPFFKNPWMQMWCMTLHEMCHAYEGVWVQSAPEPEHGKHFGSKYHAVHARARKLFGLWIIPPYERYERFD